MCAHGGHACLGGLGVCGWGGHGWLRCVWPGGHAWSGGLACPDGVSLPSPWPDGRSMSGSYASYWNAFLLSNRLFEGST